jgi:hypothetical protein
MDVVFDYCTVSGYEASQGDNWEGPSQHQMIVGKEGCSRLLLRMISSTAPGAGQEPGNRGEGEG